MWLDETAGVAWELREIKRKEHLRKLVLLSIDRNGRPMAEEKARRAIFDLGLDGRFTDWRALLYYYEVDGALRHIAFQRGKSRKDCLSYALNQLQRKHDYLGSLRKSRLGRKNGWTYVRRLVTMGALGLSVLLAHGTLPAETPSFAGPGVTYEGKLADRSRLSGQEVVKQWGRPIGSAPPLLTADEWYKLVDSKVDDPQLTPATEPVSPPLSRSADTLGALCLHAMYPAPSRRKLFPHA